MNVVRVYLPETIEAEDLVAELVALLVKAKLVLMHECRKVASS